MRIILKYLTILIVFLSLIFAGVYLVQNSVKSTTQAFLDRLFKEDVTYQFQSYATKISGKQSLYVAKLEQIEIIQRSSQARALWLKLPKVVTRLEVPVEYNFFIPFTTNWRFDRIDNGLTVHVPELVSGTPTANISKMKLEVTSGGFIFNESSAKRKLQQEVHTILIDNSIVYRDRVREQAREAIHQFVTTWLLQLGSKDGASLPVRIVFPGEDAPRPRS